MQKYRTIKEVMQNSSLKQLVHECSLYNLKAQFVEYKLDTALECAGVYIVIGRPGIDLSKINPAAVVDRKKRNSEMIYTDVEAFKITDCNVFNVLSNVSDHCTDYEFLRMLSKKYNVEMPKKLEVHDLAKIQTLRNRRDSTACSDKVRNEAEQALKKTLKEISNKYNNEKVEKSNIVSMDELIKDDAVLKVEEMEEKIYVKFKEEIKKHPEVKFYPKDKKEIYYGVPAGLFGKENEQDKREMRKIVFRECDASTVYNILNDIQLSWMSKVSVNSLKEKGPVCFATIPTGYMELFHDAAKSINLTYAVDKNENVDTKLNTVNVFVSKADDYALKTILHKMHFIKTTIHTREYIGDKER